MTDLPAELRKQLQFLRNSCTLYDQGFVEEAVRIATTIRVLIHDTAASTSLLKQMEAKGIYVMTSAPAATPNEMLMMCGITKLIATMNKPEGGPPTIEAACVPKGAEGEWRAIPVTEWWEERIHRFLDGTVLTRRSIVRDAANKDGGAHVDKLPAPYVRLQSRSGAAQVVSTNEKAQTEFKLSLILVGPLEPDDRPILNFAYADLRQMATELLASPELIALGAWLWSALKHPNRSVCGTS